MLSSRIKNSLQIKKVGPSKSAQISTSYEYKNCYNKSIFACLLSLFVSGPSGDITIVNNSTTITAINITSNFTGTALEGLVTETGKTCATLAPGATCTLSCTPGNTTVEPTNFPIQGSNTTAITGQIQITTRPVIAITGPVQQSRIVTVSGAPLNLVVTNDPSSPVNATGITVTGKAACSGLAVDASACTNLAPGASCSLVLSSTPPSIYAPCTITVGGTNTANSPTALIAFSYKVG